MLQVGDESVNGATESPDPTRPVGPADAPEPVNGQPAESASGEIDSDVAPRMASKALRSISIEFSCKNRDEQSNAHSRRRFSSMLNLSRRRRVVNRT